MSSRFVDPNRFGAPVDVWVARAWCCLVLCAGLGAGSSGCSSSSRRLSERETLQYKTQLVRSRRSEISPAKAEKLLYHPARTQREIDRAFDELALEQAREAARDNAERAKQIEAARKEAAENEEAESAASQGSGATGGDAGSDEAEEAPVRDATSRRE